MASRLAEHRQRRPRAVEAQTALPLERMQAPHSRRVADSVAARFAGTVSYRDFLQGEAEASVRQAEAAAQVARRNADAVCAAQQQMLAEIEHWNVEEPAPEVLNKAAGAVQATENREQPSALLAPPTLAPPLSAKAPVFAVAELLEMPVEPAEPAVPLPANLIEFPRQLIAARRARPRLAEGPLREEADASPERAQLRIFEVEASSVSTEPSMENVLPEWHSIRLDAHESARTAEPLDAQMSFALPVHVAPMSLRLMAVAVDGCCVLAAFLGAVVVASHASPDLPTGLQAAVSAGITLFVFGLLYYLLFFSLGDATPGMRYARIGLCTFSDENPTRGSMRRRMFALLLAGMPLGLGLVWACMDEEGLGWHDRISRMYPREY